MAANPSDSNVDAFLMLHLLLEDSWIEGTRILS
jgi:hypothetical protein